jgi:hypothetical protein
VLVVPRPRYSHKSCRHGHIHGAKPQCFLAPPAITRCYSKYPSQTHSCEQSCVGGGGVETSVAQGSGRYLYEASFIFVDLLNVARIPHARHFAALSQQRKVPHVDFLFFSAPTHPSGPVPGYLRVQIRSVCSWPGKPPLLHPLMSLLVWEWRPFLTLPALNHCFSVSFYDGQAPAETHVFEYLCR